MAPTPRRRAGVAGLGAAALLVGLLPPTAALAVDDDPTTLDDLIISEYVEGSSYNKALELYNGTSAPIDLTAYSVAVHSNGNLPVNHSVALSGTLEPGSTYVLASNRAAAEVLSVADQTTTQGLWNGDDAIVLTKDGTTVVDSFGQAGLAEDFGTNVTLRRQADQCAGDTVIDDAWSRSGWDELGVDTFDGLGAHTTTCGGDGGDTDPEPTSVVINEFSASTAGTDVEFLEILGAPSTDYSHLMILEIEGDVSDTITDTGKIDSATPVGTTDAEGRWHTDLAANTLENATMTLLLVEGYTDQTVVDADLDGVLDEGTGLTVLDSVAVHDGGAADLTYSETVLTVSYDGLPYAPGGASRIPDGTDTDTAADWVRNDFDLAGLPGFEGTLIAGEALNTPGTANAVDPGGDPGEPGDPGDPTCGGNATLIGAVQGEGDASPIVGQTVTIEGVVVGDFQHADSFSGYYVQDAGDANPATSDGIFVYAPNGADVAVGDQVRVTGNVAEYFGMTQLSNLTAVQVCGTGTVPAPVELTLPIDHEAHEGMLVGFAQDLAVLEYYEYGRYGQVVLGHGDATFRQYQPTAVFEPGSPEAEALAEFNAAHRITLDDGLNRQNPLSLRHPNGDAFDLDNLFRGGDTVSGVTGVLDYRFETWAVQPTKAAAYEQTNPRPAVPEVGGTTTVGSFNVLNYFTTLTSEDSNARGADTQEEYERQRDKIVAAIDEMNADVVGLIEIENNADVAVADLVAALNDAAGEERWAHVATGVIGTDAITTALIYQPEEVTPVGDFALLDSTVDERYLDEYNRPALAQTFEDNENEGRVTVVVNHLKSKGSGCEDAGDPTDPDGQGNCNGVRTDAADALGDWANGDPTGTGTDNVLIVGDLNSYDKEDPIKALEADGYVDLLHQFQGELAYSYVFDGMLGYLDYAMASSALTPRVTGTDAWLINADEPSVLDYDMSFKPDAQDAIYAPDAYRSSDHDPVLVGLDLAPEPPADTVAPELEVTASPSSIWPPNGKWVTVDTVIEATDDSGEVPTVTVVDVEVTDGGHKDQGRIIQETATQFRVLAAKGAVYTVTYEATDAAGNTTTESVTVSVPHNQGNGNGNGNGNGKGKGGGR